MKAMTARTLCFLTVLAIVAVTCLTAPTSAQAEQWTNDGKNANGVTQFQTTDGIFAQSGVSSPYWGFANSTGTSNVDKSTVNLLTGIGVATGNTELHVSSTNGSVSLLTDVGAAIKDWNNLFLLF